MSSNPSLPPPLPPTVIAYAAPGSYGEPAPAGVWRENAVMVVVNGTTLPHSCVKCNAATTPMGALRKVYSWHHPAVFLAIFAGVLIYVIVALVTRKKGEIIFRLCAEHTKRRKNFILMTWVLVLAGIGTLIGSAYVEDGLLALLGLGMLIGGIVTGFMAQPLRPTRIDERYLWLKGACPAYLAQLPGVVRG